MPSIPRRSPRPVASSKPGSSSIQFPTPALRFVRIVALVALTFIAYAPSLSGGFLWDDDAVSDNLLLRREGGFLQLWTNPRAIPHEGHYWPITYTSFWIEARLWGLEPSHLRISNLAIHVINALLLWAILAQLGVAGAYLAALIFALHPVHVESVAWIIERKDTLSCFFYFAATLAYLRHLNHRSMAAYAAALIFLALAMLSKSVAVTWPVAMLLLLHFKNGRITTRDVAWLIPPFLITATLVLVDLSYANQIDQYDSGLGIIARLGLAARALAFYAAKLALPINLMTIYPRWLMTVATWTWIFPLGLAAFAYALWRIRSRAILAASLFYAITLSPMLGLVDFSFMEHAFVADRFQYLASAAPIALFAATLSHIGNRSLKPFSKVASHSSHSSTSSIVSIPSIASFALIAWLLFHCRTQAALHRDDEPLFAWTLERNPNSFLAHHNIGAACNDRGDFESGIKHFKAALACGPERAEIYVNLGVSSVRLGRFDEGIAHYQKAIALAPAYDEAYVNWGTALAKQGKFAESLPLFEKAAQMNPANPEAFYNLGVAQHTLGDAPRATESFLRALELDPLHLSSLINLGAIFLNSDQYDNARNVIIRALELSPENPDAQFNMGLLLMRLNDRDGAIRHLQAALAANPNHTSARAALDALEAATP